MSFLSDVFEFEKFNVGDIWKKIKKDPERLLLGTADPASAKLWSAITGKDYEPLVDQMGGAYGGNVISFGGDGGVYGRAREAGVPTGAGSSMHDAAHVIAALIAGGSALGGGGGGGAGPGGPGFAAYSGGGGGGLGTGAGPGGPGFAAYSGGGGGAAAPAGGFNWQQMMRQMPQMQQQQQGETEQQRRIRESNQLIAMILSRGGYG